MTIGKNKKLSKRGKGSKKRLHDPFLKKEWFELIAPPPFDQRFVGKTCVNRSAGQKIASDVLKGRVCDTSLADLTKSEEPVTWRKFKLEIEDVQGRNCYTIFHGMDMTRDKQCHNIRKWQNLIETHVDVKTTEGFFLRVFVLGFTTKAPHQLRKTSYAHRSQLKAIRKKMVEVVTREVSNCTITELIKKFVAESISGAIEEQCRFIYSLTNVSIRKVKVLKKAKLDAAKLQDLTVGLNLPTANKETTGVTGEDDGTKNLLAK